MADTKLNKLLYTVSYSREFIVGGFASSTACLFTNPLDVVKTRFQLQGELQTRGAYVVKYKNIFDAFMKIFHHEGMSGLQKGLIPALSFQIVMNSSCLGIYQTIINTGITGNGKGQQVFSTLLAAGAFSGCCWALLGTSFYLVKVQMQSAANPSIAVGYQHKHSGLIAGLKAAHVSSGGLFQGLSSALARTTVGSATQLATFTTSKQIIGSFGVIKSDFGIVCASSLCSSIAVTFTMTPFDVVATRMFNQKHGLYYNGWWDCTLKIFKHEGIYGFYKGTFAHFFRIGPHTILTLIIWDRYRKWFF